ncbi:nonsense-mediated mRNA decay factor SMG7 isoform X3 [Dunckerocampus dactyliophorus]|uniref:nonsense-mediated mRNA decay factor SMG7 isoform X3 n=1 Tax=Dunckerocampus dactyliophorus TaxID=161453 RepID=UPI002405E460|nr:nonsense-mediated mRNA decay factor SMG7 isoform X3 [Dunckerocampus dactyliophorus]
MSLCSQYLRQAEALKADMTVCHADSKLVAAEAWTSRQALQDLYQKMLVTDLEYALDKKVEQDLWNHAFKNQITTLQSQAKNRANPNRSEVQANLSLFLEAASGFYTQLLQELCTVFNVDLPCRVKTSQLGIISNRQNNGSAIVTPQPSSCSYICQHCLVHLGDIARYRNQTSQAESYYRHAAQLVPSNGQPYNQLAILASSKGDHLTTIFYYCRSIAVKFPFPAASTNLQKALSKALESREDVRSKWSVSDFIKAFIKFHGHVYLGKSVDQLDALRERLEENFQRLILQKAFSSQQLVHITVINLFELHHLRELAADGAEQQVSWFQLLGLFMSFLGIMCRRVLLNKNRDEEVAGECPLPAIKISLDWLRLRPGMFHEAAVDERQHVWPWLVSILNSFHPKNHHVSSCSVTPLPEEFELQGFLALRPALRSLDFTKGHQGVPVDRDVLLLRTRHQRLITLGKWVADNQPGLIQCRVGDDDLLFFITDIPEQAIEEPAEKEPCVLQEASNGEQVIGEGANTGLKSVLSVGKAQNSWSDGADRPVVTFKENIKPREQNRESARGPHQKDSGKERRDFAKGNGTSGKSELKRDGKRKCELKKVCQEKVSDAGKQVKAQTELRKTPVSEAKKTPATQTQATCSSQFIPIHHPGAFPPLPSRPGFPASAFVIPPPVAFPGLQVNPGFTFSTGVSVPGPFLQTAVHTQAGSQVQSGKQSHIPYSQQRPSGPAQGPGSSGQGPVAPGPLQGQQPPSQLQVQVVSQQSPTKPVQQVGMGKSPPHHSGLQQPFLQLQDQQMWSQNQAALQKIPAIPMSLKQQQFYLAPQDPVKVYDHQLAPQTATMDKKMKFPPYWDPSFRVGDGPAAMVDRIKRPQIACPEQDVGGPRGPPFEDKSSPLLPPDLLKTLADFEEEEELVFSKPPDFFQALAGPLSTLPGPNIFLPNQTRMESGPEVVSHSSSLLPMSGLPLQEYNQNSIFSQAYGKNLAAGSKSDAPMMHQEPSLYSLFEWTPWSPSLHTNSDHSTPASQSPHSSNPSSLPSSPPTHNHAATQFSNFGPIGTPDSRERRTVDRWKAEKTGEGGASTSMCWILGLHTLTDACVCLSGGMSDFGLDYLPTSSASDTSWHQVPSAGSSWTNQESPMEESSSTSIWSSSMMQPGPSALEQLLLQQKQKQQRGHGAMNPPH